MCVERKGWNAKERCRRRRRARVRTTREWSRAFLAVYSKDKDPAAVSIKMTDNTITSRSSLVVVLNAIYRRGEGAVDAWTTTISSDFGGEMMVL
jgi:hypothetical protein